MFDFANYKVNSDNPNEVLRAKFDDNSNVEIKSTENVPANGEIFVNPGVKSDNYLMHHGIVLPNNNQDCYMAHMSFSQKAEDQLKEMRKYYFGHFFLFDNKHNDEMSECLSLANPFSRRFLFFHYVTIMDEIDMEKYDPKRNGLEYDPIVMDTAKNALEQALAAMSTETNDTKRADQASDYLKKMVIEYTISQRALLENIIKKYDEQSYRLNKDDIL